MQVKLLRSYLVQIIISSVGSIIGGVIITVAIQPYIPTIDKYIRLPLYILVLISILFCILWALMSLGFIILRKYRTLKILVVEQSKKIPDVSGRIKRMFENIKGIQVAQIWEHELSAQGIPNAHVVILNSLHAGEKNAEANLISYTKQGGGLIVIHDALSPYLPTFEHIRNIMGIMPSYDASYEKDGQLMIRLGRDPVNMQTGERITDVVSFPVSPIDGKHPVCKGVETFMIKDELIPINVNPELTKPLFRVDVNDNIPLEEEDDYFRKKSPFTVGGYRKYGKGRVFFFTFGHFPDTYDNESFQRIIKNAVSWAGKRLGFRR